MLLVVVRIQEALTASIESSYRLATGATLGRRGRPVARQPATTIPLSPRVMANTGVAGRVVFAGSDTGILGVTVAAFDVDPLTGEEHLGSAVTGSDGRFTISYSPSKYRMWFAESSDPDAGPNPDIEVRFYGEGQRLLFERPKQSNVQVDTLDVGQIEIHRNNFRVPDTASEA